ncbi:hypothetical protein ACMV_29630 [Acidiphilium multivorum AIU301]|uniref:FecR protein domain-containing protein n=1 Tax=Acidiphilium multivorum (strain DSM 11245 / JCM 8867 / NBRC 100883 / AIU 301) TaxID=926570 RepID=F0J4W3_ACIMA|nr:DUF6600 domain-containing protein [Acidiphilium multivorum]BAJ82310.1 hypothetical protein ACMV_29630 [Acidiphilium multivorum AIU301]
MRRQFATLFHIAWLLAALLAGTTATARAQANGAPPARVGQIARIEGAVSFARAGGEWEPATPNYPLIGGDTLYAEPGAEAALTFGWSRITLAGGTEFGIAALGEDSATLDVPRGEAFLDLRYLAPGETWRIRTPRGVVTIGQDGRYAISAGDAAAPTRIGVIDGAAEVTGDGGSLRLGPGETARLAGATPVRAMRGPLETDPFIERMLAEAAPPAPPGAPAVVTGMTGAGLLAAYGSWGDVPDYGAIWYPRVGPGWAPYRHGHWAYVPPWGWTWIDDAPWGFAPFHYGRWLHRHGRWGWLPAPVPVPPRAPPVYAPALVAFFNVAPGISVGVGLNGGAVGWVPLAPGEPFLPWYSCPPAYVERLNRFDVRDPARYRDPRAPGFAAERHPARLANRMAATLIGPEALRRGDAVGRFGHPAPERALAAARPMLPGRTAPAYGGFLRMPLEPARPAPAPARPAMAPAPGRPGVPAAPGVPGSPPRAMPAPGIAVPSYRPAPRAPEQNRFQPQRPQMQPRPPAPAAPQRRAPEQNRFQPQRPQMQPRPPAPAAPQRRAPEQNRFQPQRPQMQPRPPAPAAPQRRAPEPNRFQPQQPQTRPQTPPRPPAAPPRRMPEQNRFQQQRPQMQPRPPSPTAPQRRAPEQNRNRQEGAS